MEVLLGGVFLVIVVLLVLLLVQVPKNQHLNQQITALQSQLADIQKRQTESANQSLQQQAGFYQRSQAMLNDVHRKLGGLEQASRQVQELGRDIGRLQDILRRRPSCAAISGSFCWRTCCARCCPSATSRPSTASATARPWTRWSAG